MWRSAMPFMRLLTLVAVVGGIHLTCGATQGQIVKSERKFTIENDRFVKDGKPLQIISGRSVPLQPMLGTIMSKLILYESWFL